MAAASFGSSKLEQLRSQARSRGLERLRSEMQNTKAAEARQLAQAAGFRVRREDKAWISKQDGYSTQVMACWEHTPFGAYQCANSDRVAVLSAGIDAKWFHVGDDGQQCRFGLSDCCIEGMDAAESDTKSNRQ